MYQGSAYNIFQQTIQAWENTSITDFITLRKNTGIKKKKSNYFLSEGSSQAATDSLKSLENHTCHFSGGWFGKLLFHSTITKIQIF